MRTVSRLLLVFACLAWALLPAPAAAGRPITVVVDPGHGGAQDGAQSASGLREKTLALGISKRLRAALQEELGAQVLLTRERDADLSLSGRVEYAARKKADLFISVHANSVPTRRLRRSVEGVETYFLSAHASGQAAASVADRENAEGARTSKKRSDTLSFILDDLQQTEAHGDSSRLAYAVHARLVKETKAIDRGVQQAPFFVLSGLAVPAILVEVGYISHPKEGRRLEDEAYQERIARGIARGVKAFVAELAARDGKAGVARGGAR